MTRSGDGACGWGARVAKGQGRIVCIAVAEHDGQLGELLHYKFFTNNEHWAIKKPLGGKPHRSLADFLPLLNEGIAELRQATSGSLLSNPRFTKLVQDVAEEATDEPGPGEG